MAVCGLQKLFKFEFAKIFLTHKIIWFFLILSISFLFLIALLLLWYPYLSYPYDLLSFKLITKLTQQFGFFLILQCVYPIVFVPIPLFVLSCEYALALLITLLNGSFLIFQLTLVEFALTLQLVLFKRALILLHISVNELILLLLK